MSNYLTTDGLKKFFLYFRRPPWGLRPVAFATSATAPLKPRQHGTLQILYCIVWLIRHWVYYSKDFARQSPTLARPTAPLATCVQWISSADKTNNTTRIHIVSISVDTVNEKRLPRQRPLRNWKTNVRLIVPSCGSVPSLKIRQRSVRSMLIEKTTPRRSSTAKVLPILQTSWRSVQ